MIIMKKKLLLQFPVLLALACSASFAGAETGTTQSAPEVADQATPTALPYRDPALRQDCPYGVCQEASLPQPRLDSVVGSDVMPTFDSPALNPTVDEKAGC